MIRPIRLRSNMRNVSLFLVAGSLSLISVVGACSRSRQVHDDSARAVQLDTKQSSDRPAIGYPKARWRLVPFEKLNDVALWVSHIVVMHANSRIDATLLRPPGWNPDPPTPNRTEEAALSRALTIAELAAQDPARFEELARKYSDDVTTREEGGSLGGTRAGQLPPEYLDALIAIRPGEVSRVFQSAAGFHVVKRRALPPDEPVAGQRVVIRYAGTAGGLLETESTRTRSEALARAREVAELAESGTKSFDWLVGHYSDCFDARDGGDLGVRSTRDPGFEAREFEHLSKQKIGEVSEPIDSAIGYQVLLRTAALPRRDAFRATEVRHELPNPDGPNFDALVRYTDGATLAQGARDLSTEARRGLKLTAEQMEEVTRVLGEVAASFEKHAEDPAARVENWRRALAILRSALGPAAFRTFDDFLNTWATTTIISRMP